MAIYFLREDGNDSNSGTTDDAAGAWRTFAPGNSGGAHEFQPKDVVYVRAGSGFGSCVPDDSNWVGSEDGFIVIGAGIGSTIITAVSFGQLMFNIEISDLRISGPTTSYVHNGAGLIWKRIWSEASVYFDRMDDTIIENNYFDLGSSYQVSFRVADYGGFIARYNTIYGEQDSESTTPMIYFDGQSGHTPSASQGCNWYNNVIYRKAGDFPRYIWLVALADYTHWDLYFHIEGNVYDYDDTEDKFGYIYDWFDELSYSKFYDEFEDWQLGFSGVWSGRDVLGVQGELHLGQDPENSVVYSLGWNIGELEEKSVAIDAGMGNVGTTDNYDIRKGTRPVGKRPDAGCYEVRPALVGYTVYGFTSKLYENFNKFLSTVQCAVFLQYELDFPDQILFKVSFNGGNNYNTLLDSHNGVNYTEESFSIPEAYRGHDLIWKLEIWIHDSNKYNADIGTPRRVDLEYFSNAHLTEGVPAGTEVDIYDAEYNFITRVISGRNADFEKYLPPGTYRLKLYGGGKLPEWKQVTVGHGTFFGRYSEQVGDIWHQFQKAKDWTLFNGIQWASYMVWDHFVDESLRYGGAGIGCPNPMPSKDPYYPNTLIVRQGKALKCRSGVDMAIVLMDPTLYPELE